MSELQIFNCEQNSPEWFACRMGIPTASEFHALLAKGGNSSVTRRKYMLTLIGEIIIGKSIERFSNAHTRRGHEMEVEARHLYEMISDEPLEAVGFMRRGNAGASPDRLVGIEGMLEIKTKEPHLQIECLLADEVPGEHMAQLQGQLWIAVRPWVDFVSYWPGLPLFRKRVFRDETYIARIKTAVDDFNAELTDLLEKVKAK